MEFAGAFDGDDFPVSEDDEIAEVPAPRTRRMTPEVR
jgi:hypothetical protein